VTKGAFLQHFVLQKLSLLRDVVRGGFWGATGVPGAPQKGTVVFSEKRRNVSLKMVID